MDDVAVVSSGHLLDRSTQAWVRVTGQELDLNEHPWLQGPVGERELIGDSWLAAEAVRLGGRLHEGGGLVAMDTLRGPRFDPSALHPNIVAFYENTSDWNLDVWSQWSPAAWPFGWAVSATFARRLRQLALPLRPLDVAQGMASTVRTVDSADGRRLGALWLRTLRSTGQTVYSGWYGTALLPGSEQPSVRVVFPLPRGSVTVFLKPEVDPSGALLLTSPTGTFGDDGAYLVVAEPGHDRAWVRRVPIVERFRVYADGGSNLRTDHALDLWSIPVIRLHYRMAQTDG